jgi:hypothetical protein
MTRRGWACIDWCSGTKREGLPRSMGQDDRYTARGGVRRPDQEVFEFQSGS